jgi:hypothetical protein
MKLNEFIKSLKEDDIDMPRFETTQYSDEDIIEALLSEKPENELKSVFGEDFWPKIKRWLDVELKDVKVSDEEKEIIGGELKAKLDKYLEREEPEYEENAKDLARTILNSYKKWSEKEIKDKDLPHEKIGQGG